MTTVAITELMFGDIRLPARFWRKVRVLDAGCWEWVGARYETGYGSVYAGKLKTAIAHRFAYRALVGEVPPGLVLDHLCRNRSCVNPAHLEPVPQLENVRRGRNHNREKSACIRGHEFDAENTGISASGKRYCRTCMNKGLHPSHMARRTERTA